MDVDFGRSASDYARHRAGFPEAFYDRLAALGVGVAGQRLLDLGTGTGTMARTFARCGARVTALDPKRALLDEARRLAAEEGVAVELIEGVAERTGFGDGAFDVVTAGQCWHWFDRARAAVECRRVLAPGGRIALCHFDWLPLPGNVVEATTRLILRYNPAWGKLQLSTASGEVGLYPAWLYDLSLAGFRGLETFSFDVDVPYTHAGWRGRVRASAGVGASLPPAEVAAFDGELGAILDEKYPGELAVPHRAWAVVGRN